jgi:DNA-binding response OmpR family regulator
MNDQTSQTNRPQRADSAPGEVRAVAEGQARVLLVEDDAALRRYLGTVLRRAGYEVAEAADGVEGLRLALSSRFSVVVTDAVMPRLTGPELCRLLRARPGADAPPVLLLTGLETDDTQSAAARPNARLAKPVSAGELLACVAHLLDRAN